MDELINMVSQKAGIPQDKAKQAVETVLNYLKQRLPAPIAGQIDGVLAGGNLPGDITKGLGDMLGGKK